MPQWTPNPSSQGMTTREMNVVNRLHHLVDGPKPLDPDVKPVVADGLKLILELIEDRGSGGTSTSNGTPPTRTEPAMRVRIIWGGSEMDTGGQPGQVPACPTYRKESNMTSPAAPLMLMINPS
jgi:hypothetical protein